MDKLNDLAFVVVFLIMLIYIVKSIDLTYKKDNYISVPRSVYTRPFTQAVSNAEISASMAQGN